MGCPDEETLFGYLSGQRTAPELQEHISSCKPCREQLASLQTAPASGEDPEATAHRGPQAGDNEDAVAELSGKQPKHENWLLSRGEMIDHFSIVRSLGRGTSGEVYLARDGRLGRKIALKLLLRAPAEASELQQALLEARLVASFSHPNIVSIYSAGTHAGRVYLALEYLEGETLHQRLLVERMTVLEALRIGVAIADAVCEAHAHGVHHRDLKPANVVIAKDGRPRVVDFGLAIPEATRLDGSDTAPAGQDAGTPAYMAPEQWAGTEITAAVDIWALGVMLHEMLYDERPYEGRRMIDLRKRVCDRDHVVRLNPLDGLSDEATEMIESMLAKDRAERPSAEQAAQLLRIEQGKLRRPTSRDESPFRGLLAFDERHAELFFGRDGEIESFLERLRLFPVLPIVGPSGAGKSSFVKAGVIPRLRKQGSWTLVELRPGTDPFLLLATRLH